MWPPPSASLQNQVCVASLTALQHPGMPWSCPLSSPEAQKLTLAKAFEHCSVLLVEFFRYPSSLPLLVLFCSVFDEQKEKREEDDEGNWNSNLGEVRLAHGGRLDADVCNVTCSCDVRTLSRCLRILVPPALAGGGALTGGIWPEDLSQLRRTARNGPGDLPLEQIN